MVLLSVEREDRSGTLTPDHSAYYYLVTIDDRVPVSFSVVKTASLTSLRTFGGGDREGRRCTQS